MRITDVCNRTTIKVTLFITLIILSIHYKNLLKLKDMHTTQKYYQNVNCLFPETLKSFWICKEYFFPYFFWLKQQFSFLWHSQLLRCYQHCQLHFVLHHKISDQAWQLLLSLNTRHGCAEDATCNGSTAPLKNNFRVKILSNWHNTYFYSSTKL